MSIVNLMLMLAFGIVGGVGALGMRRLREFDDLRARVAALEDAVIHLNEEQLNAAMRGKP